ncbi:hypothetical protein AB0O28_18600 [Microbispora sp. NPDC088329]|uniref:hypothetical protein n=1 Tax=Microbispora sp. NPDC088329 TaxID=3154869 RepID=UPI0034484F81
MNLLAVLNAFPSLRNLAPSVPTPQPAYQTADYCFLREGPNGERQVCLLFAGRTWAKEIVTSDGVVKSSDVTSLTQVPLDQWFAERYTARIQGGWRPGFVSPPTEIPDTP